MSDTPIPSVDDAPVEQIILKRGFTVHRMRETQPVINAPAQDTIPGQGSGDE